MRLTKTQLKQLIKEELQNVLKEGPPPPMHGPLASRIWQLEKKVNKLDEFLGQMEFHYGKMPDTVKKLTHFIETGSTLTPPTQKNN